LDDRQSCVFDPSRSQFTPRPQGRAGQIVICFSHLRWDFVFQRPQHLMSRFAKGGRRVLFFEEPIRAAEGQGPSLAEKVSDGGVVVLTPMLPEGMGGQARETALRLLLDRYLEGSAGEVIRWYYTPMMLPFSRHIEAVCTVYDCMDELKNFKFAPPELAGLEQELFAAADVVFTGGYSLYEAKRGAHANIHPFPSSVDREHFGQARRIGVDPEDQIDLPHPRLGFYGVIDERMDLDLLAAVADAHPEWSLVMVGPVVKIDPADLPSRRNIAYLGGKSYPELPAYLSGWDVALMPFAINESTEFISPTKTPEYLAGGKPVVSTPVTDVIRHYGALEGVKIADGPDAFVAACEQALALKGGGSWMAEVDQMLSALSWDETFRRMDGLIAMAIEARGIAANAAVRAFPAAPAIRPASRAKPYDYLIVGAGFAGSVLAERLTKELGKRVLLIDRRPHVGGNAYDEKDVAGVLMHKYGPHIFHTNSSDIAGYLSNFTKWRPYEHRVLADVGGLLVPIPINRTTLNTLYGAGLETDAQVEAYLAARAEPVAQIRTSEDVVISKVGRELYETFFRGYTRKQWGLDPSELDKSVTARVPTRTNTDDRYFNDTFQAMPAAGYTRMFENMLDQKGLEIETGVEWEDIRGETICDHTVFCGPVDEYFDHRFGALPYRSLEFKHETLDREWLQPVAVINHPSESTPYTRVSEYKHITGQSHPKTTVTYEFPKSEGDPYYPVPRPENQALYKKYEALALAERDVTFVGRLATYRYYNMDQVVGQALTAFRRLAEREGREAGVVRRTAALA